MDRRTLIVIIVCTVVVIGYNLLYFALYPPKPPSPPQPPAAPETTKQIKPPSPDALDKAPAQRPSAPPQPRPPEKTVVLKTPLQEVEFTTYGGAIKKITLLPRADGVIREPVVFTSPTAPPLMSTAGLESTEEAVYEFIATESTEYQVVFQTKSASGLVIRKIFSLFGDYQLQCKLLVENPAQQPAEIGPYELSLGTARGLNGGSLYDQPGVDWYNGKVPRHDAQLSWFDPSNFLFIIPIHGKRELYRAAEQRKGEPVVWAATKNQYFATIVTPAKPAVDLKAWPVELPLPEKAEKKGPPPRGVAASLIFQKTVVAGGKTEESTFHIYSGPKEFKRLMALSKDKTLGFNQHEVMQLGTWIGPIARLLLRSMLWLHSVVFNYGLAIIVITVLVKLIFWPVTAASMRSMKRMQKLQPLMTSLRQKYKDDPQRLNAEMMKLYRQHKVNPLGGCLPMLIQIPVFFGLFAMLRGAIELRGSSFLWIRDLSQPDTIFHIPLLGIPFNPLPLAMVGTMVWQQKITPTTMDPKQAKLMMLMPLIMLLFFYNASSGLALYWTVQQLLSVGQQYWMNAHPDKEQPLPKPAPKKKNKRKKRLLGLRLK